MILRILLLVAAMIASVAAFAQTSKPLAIGTSFQLPSPAFGAAREVNVWLPPSYATGTRTYPVVYVVDGGAAQDFHHISGLAQLATINGGFEELIVVGIATQARSAELTAPPTDPRFKSWPQATGGAATFRRHIAAEVVPFVERRYRTSGRRALIGESLAGLFVLETFLGSPKLFTDYIAVSPSLWWDGKALSRQAPALLRAHNADKRRLYLTMADEGGTMRTGLDAMLAALPTEAPRGLALTYVDRRRTDTHSTIYHGAALDALRTLFPMPPYDYGPEPWYRREGSQPPKRD